MDLNVSYGWRLHSTEVAHLLPTQQPWFDSQYSRNFIRKGKMINVAEVNQWCWLKERGQWLDKVDRTLALASGNLVLKTFQTST